MQQWFLDLMSLVLGCDECIWHLIGDLRNSNKTLDQLKVGVLNISTGAAANDRLKYYDYTAHRLQVLVASCLIDAYTLL